MLDKVILVTEKATSEQIGPDTFKFLCVSEKCGKRAECNSVVIHCRAVGFVGLEPNPALTRPSGTMSISLLFYSLPSLP